MSKIKHKLVLYKDDYTKRVYEGRVLGFVTAEEYNAILNVPKLKFKIFNYETQPLKSLVKLNNVKAMRLVMAIQKINDKAEYSKKLFVTEPLDMVSYYDNEGAYICAQSGRSLELEEKIT